jgi:hypothetical protein
MKADLDRGWRELQNTYGFFCQTRIPYREDLTIRAQLNVIAQPGSFDDWAQSFPDVALESGDRDFNSVLSQC